MAFFTLPKILKYVHSILVIYVSTAHIILSLNIKTSINTLGNALNTIRNLTYTFDGATEKLNPTTIVAYTKALDGLSLKQAQIALSTKGMTEAQKEQILVSTGLISTENAISGAEIQRAMASNGIEQEIIGQILIEKKLAEEKTGELIVTNTLTEAKLRNALAEKQIVGTKQDEIISSIGVANANAAESLSFDGLTASIGASTKALWTFLTTNPVGWAILAATAIGGTIFALNKYNKAQEEAIEKAQELQKEYRTFASDTSSHIQSLKDEQDEFKRLSKGVDDYGNNISLTADEYSRYKEIVAEILGYSPDLIAGYDDEGNAIAKKNSLIERSIELMKEEQKERLKELTSEKTTKDLYKGVKKDVDNARVTQYPAFIASPPTDVPDQYDFHYDVYLETISGITGEDVEFYPDMYTSEKEVKDYADYLTKYKDIITTNYDGIRDKLSRDTTLSDGTVVEGLDEDTTNKFIEYIKGLFDTMDALEERSHKFDDRFMSFAQRADSYEDLTNAQKNFVTEYIKATGSVVDAEGNSLSEDEIYEKAKAYTKFAENLATDPNLDVARDKIDDLFSLDKKSLSAQDFETQVDDMLAYLKEKFQLDEDAVKNIKISFGFEFLSDGSTRTSTLIKQVQDILYDEFDGEVSKLSLPDLEVAAKIAVDSQKSKEDIEKELTEWGEGGNVKLLVRPVVDADVLNDVGWDAGDGQATVFTSTYSNKDNTVAINFTPIIADENGNFIDVLEPDALEEYAMGVIEGVHDDYYNLQIGAQFEGKYAVQQAEQAAKEIHKLHQAYFIDDEVQLSWDELKKKIIETNQAAEGALNLEKFNKSIDDMQSAYSTLKKARDEYNKEGSYSLDTLQSLLALEPQYLAMLVNENGQLVLNEQAMYDIVQAELENAKSKLYGAGIAELNALAEKKAGEASEDSADKKSSAVADINAETEALGVNTKAALINAAANARNRGVTQEEVDAIVDKYTSYADAIDKIANNANFDFTMTGDSVKDTAKKIDDVNRQIADLDKKKNLDTIKHKFDAWNLSVEKLNNTMSLLDNTLDLISEYDHIGKIQTTTLQLDLAREKAGLLANEFTELQNTEYDSADAANELASRMKSVADEIADNQKNILEYGKNIAQYYGDALKAVGTLSKTQIDEATNLLDRNIKSLEEGGLIGLSFSLSPVATPQSAIEKQRQENKTLEEEMQAHYNAVENMQKIALDMQFKETMEDYARQREELVKSLNEVQIIIHNHNDNIEKDNKDTNDAIETDQKDSDKSQQNEAKDHALKIENIFTGLNNWLLDNPLRPPVLDKVAMEKTIADAKDYANKIQSAWSSSMPSPFGVNFGQGREAAVNAARSEIGYAPGINASNKFSGWVVKGSGEVAQAWCADFVSWALAQGGIKNIKSSSVDGLVAQTRPTTTPKVGDLAVRGSGQNAHVELISRVNPDGTVTTIGGNTGNGEVKEHVRTNWDQYRTYATGTGTFGYNGVAGENYKPEYLRDKRTGEMMRVDSPTLIDTTKVDVIGEKETAKAENHKFANGTVDPMDIAKYIRSHYPEVTDSAIAGILGNIAYESSFDQFNKTVEEYGGGNKSLIARRGLFQLDDTRIPNWSSIVASGDWTKQIDTALAEGRYQNSGMGNSQKHNMWQYLTDSSLSAADVAAKWDSLYERSDGKTRNQRMDKANEYLSQIKSLGLSVDANTSAMSNNVAAIAKADVITRIKDLIDSGSSNSSVAGKEGFEDGLVEFIENNLTAGEGTTERLISAFEAMTQTDAEYKEQFKGLIQNLRDSAGTADYGNVRAQLSDSVANYTEAILGEQAKYQTIAIKETFDRAQEARQLALDYYNQRKADNASADELAILAQTISDLDTEIQGYSDQYVSVMSSYTDYLVKGADREMRVYNERISWQNKVNDELQREVDHASSTTEKMSAIDKLTDSYIKKQEILNEKMDAAHQSAEDLRHNAEFSPIFETFDTYAWFDAEGNATAQFERDREALSLSSPELVPLLNRAFELLQKYTQEWQSANEETKQNADLIKDLELDKAQTKVEQYTKNLQRLNEIDDVRKSKQDAITSAMEKQHSLAQSLREETANITAELDSIMHTEQWLDNDTREIIFNKVDFDTEMQAINDIQAKANRLYKNYQRNLANLTETEWYKEAKITDEYNKQMDILNEKLNVSKQEIALKKKELEYNNALKERDTRIIIGGRSVQVANPDAMYNLAKERSLAQSELSNTLLTNRESEQERRSDRISQGINQEILAREKMVELLGKMDDAQVKAYANMLPVIDELEMFGNMLSDINVPWMNAHSRDYREQFADLPDIYKISGYNLGYDYAGGYDVVEDLYASGIISDEIMRAYSKQLESQHDLKRSTDINTAQYPDTYLYGGKHYADEYGIDDESRYQEQLLREQSREYSQLAYEINHGRGTQAQLDHIKELNDNNARDNKYIANTLDTTLYTVNEDGIVVREGQKIGLDDDSMQQVGEIARGVVQTVVDVMPKEGSMAHGDYSAAKPKQKVGEIAHGNYNKYADGTKSAKAGLALTDEEGYELKLKQLGGKFRALDGGEMIFSNPQSANLFEFSQNPPNYIAEQIAKMNGQMASVVTNTSDNRSVVNNNYNIEKMSIEDPSDPNAIFNAVVQKANGRYDVTKNIRV